MMKIYDRAGPHIQRASASCSLKKGLDEQIEFVSIDLISVVVMS